MRKLVKKGRDMAITWFVSFIIIEMKWKSKSTGIEIIDIHLFLKELKI